MAAEDSEVAVPSLSLRDFIAVLRRRKTIALITFALVVGLIALGTLLTRPQYISSAKLMLEDQNGASGPTTDTSGFFVNQAGLAITSQVQLLSSPLILNQVFEQTQVPPGAVNVDVSRIEQTNAIQIVGTSDSPDYVYKVVSMVPEVYQANRRAEGAREANAELEFSKKDLAEENQKLLDTEAAIAEFKRRNDLLDPDGEAQRALERAAASRSNLQSARADITSVRAQIQALQGQLETLPPTVNTPVVTTNPAIQDLRNKLATLQSDRKAQSFLYKDSADPIRQLDLEIATLKEQIANTPPTVTTNSVTTNPNVADTTNRIASLRADLSAKEASARVLVAQTKVLEDGLGRFTDISRQLAQLNRDLEASQVAVRQGKEKVRVLSVKARAQEKAAAPITKLQEASPPIKLAASPARNLVLALFVGALLACAAAFVQDSLDDRVRDEDEARQILGAPVLGYFPLLPVSDERQILDMEKPDRLLLETFRALRSNVQFALVNSSGKKLQVTSTVPNEGKSYIASNLAITMALDGRRVILVDADLHRPTMHERFGARRQPGLTNVLVGETNLMDALQDVGFDNLQLLSAGALPPNPAELLNSPAMAQVMQELERHADLIIFDTPPLLATSDSQLMSAKMDGVVFVMQMGSVARSGTLRAFELLKQAHANVIGIVFNKVDAGKTATAYESYSGHYALDSVVADDEILIVPSKKLPSGPTNGSFGNGNSNGNGNGSHHANGAANGAANGVANGAHAENVQDGQATVFDDVLRSDENSR